MTPEQLMDFLQDLLGAHGLQATRHNEWLLPNDRLPAIRGTWDRENRILEIQVALGKERTIDECFAGIGDGEDACRDALQNFSLGSLHVLLVALWDCANEDEITVEDWHLPSGHCKAYLGNFVPRTSADTSVDIPPGTFDAIETALKSESLSPGLHWARTFIANMGTGERILEALLDNEPWEAGERALSNTGWPASETFYSVRHFLLLDVIG